MKLALSAKVTCDPKRLLADRWAHDTAHVFLQSILRARHETAARGKARKH